MRVDTDRGQTRHEEFGKAIVEDALAIQNGVLLRVKRSGVVLKILDQRAGLWSFVKDLRLAFINLAAAGHHNALRGQRYAYQPVLSCGALHGFSSSCHIHIEKAADSTNSGWNPHTRKG